jgi:peroxiredoxin family protein
MQFVFFQRLEEGKNKELEASKAELTKERETKEQMQTEQLSNKEKELQKSVAACTKAVRLFYPFP